MPDPTDLRARVARLHDLEDQLARAIATGTQAGTPLFALSHPDAPPLAALREVAPIEAPTATNPCELAVGWIPAGVPVTAYFYVDGKALPGGGTVRGGRVFVAVPDALLRPRTKVLAVLRFWQSGWRYQLWARAGGLEHRLGDGTDPDVTSGSDNLVFKEVVLPIEVAP